MPPVAAASTANVRGPLVFMIVNVAFAFIAGRAVPRLCSFYGSSSWLFFLVLSSRQTLSSTSINNPIGFRDSFIEVLD